MSSKDLAVIIDYSAILLGNRVPYSVLNKTNGIKITSLLY